MIRAGILGFAAAIAISIAIAIVFGPSLAGRDRASHGAGSDSQPPIATEDGETIQRATDAASGGPRNEAQTSGDRMRASPGRMRVPEIVNRIDGLPYFRGPVEQRLLHARELRALADAGWSAAMVALAPVVAKCISDPPETEAQIRARVDPATILRLGDSKRWSDMTLEEREAERRWHVEAAERAIEQDRLRIDECAVVQPTDPDRLMDWLEQALLEQPPDFFRAVLEDGLIPDDEAWIVRNAERLAAFNRGLLAAVRARVASGDRQLLDLAKDFFAYGRFQPEPDLETAAIYAYAARQLPGSSRRPGRVMEELLEPLDPDERERLRETGRALYERCCRDLR